MAARGLAASPKRTRLIPFPPPLRPSPPQGRPVWQGLLGQEACPPPPAPAPARLLLLPRPARPCAATTHRPPADPCPPPCPRVRQVWRKPLSGSRDALMLVNLGSSPLDVTARTLIRTLSNALEHTSAHAKITPPRRIASGGVGAGRRSALRPALGPLRGQGRRLRRVGRRGRVREEPGCAYPRAG